jgi:transposase
LPWLTLAARRAAKELAELDWSLVAGLESQHLVKRQAWLIEEALRVQDTLARLDRDIHDLLWGNPEEGIDQHPYTPLLFSFPTMSNTWAATLIGDVQRFGSEKELMKYLGFTPESKQSGTSVHSTRMTYDGNRDSRRVLFQMALVLVGPQMHNVFKAYYERKVAQGMPKMRALGHLCGKLSKLIYRSLKTRQPYSARVHAAACGIEWDERYARVARQADPSLHLALAGSLAEDGPGPD